jgi:hypothetical protein
MNQCPSKDKPIEVTFEYESTPDGEERLSEIFNLLLSKENRCQKNASLE